MIFPNKIFLLLLHVSMFFSASGQETEPAENYIRPEKKVYKSLQAALQQPDSVFILELKGKKLKEFPEDIFKLPHLVVLDLSKNKIRNIPSRIHELRNLEELDLSSNKISVIPVEVTQLTSLKKLSLNRNIIEFLPPETGKLTQLQYLELWDNEINDLPDEIKELKNLKILELRGILFSEEQQQRFLELLPNAKVYMSPSCNCKTQ
jgi:Leucine-rich repeat (LRR) protein